MTDQPMTKDEAKFILYFHWRPGPFFMGVMAGAVPNAQQAIDKLEASGLFERYGPGYRPTEQAVETARRTVFGWMH